MEITTEKREDELRSANDWIRESKVRPIPRALFGEFWREGETAVLFGDTGKGKSVLAMQIAESIASGRGIRPFKRRTEPQTVLYLDMEMNDKQFETRYAADHHGGSARFLKNHYVFSDRLIREEFDASEIWMESGEKPADVFYRKLRDLIIRSEAKVVIIDSLSCLKRSFYGVRETLELIRVLKKLRKEMDLSILALVQTPKRADSLPVTPNDLRGLRILCNRAESVFGIGQNSDDPAGRYIKRVRSLGDATHFDGLHLPAFRLKKIGGNFLGFEFERFAPEIELISEFEDSRDRERIDNIRRLSDDGKSIRAIAAEIGLPKTTVHRLLEMWRPAKTQAIAVSELGAAENDRTKSEYYFPGREEYDEAANDPRFTGIYGQEGEEIQRLRSEAYLIESAAARARAEFKKTGKTPPLAAMLERMRQLKKADNSLKEPGPDGETPSEDPEPPNPKRPALLTGLKRSVDNNGREIFIEKEDSRGKPVVWYMYGRSNDLSRMERDTFGSSGRPVDGPICVVRRG